MKKKLFERIEIQFKKPIYRFFMLIFGLPTFLVSSVAYLLSKNKTVDGRKKCVDDAVEQLSNSGELERARREAREHLENKYRFFDKKPEGTEFEKELVVLTKKAEDELIQLRANAIMAETGAKKKANFIQYVVEKLTNSNLLLVLSVISSLPFYIFMLLCISPFSRYAIERIAMMVFVIFGVVFVVFTILHFSSSDPATNVLGEAATEEQKADFNRTYGLDQPYIVQLANQFKKIITFDLGKSYSGNEDVLEALMRKFPATLILSLCAIAFGLIVSLPLGIIAAMKPNTAWDYLAMFIAMMLLSLPQFWFGMIMILSMSIKLGILPATFDTGNWATYIMPSIVMGSQFLASVTRMTRSSMLEVKSQDYVVTAKAKGLSNLTVVVKHTLGNALIPIITVVGLQFGQILGGSAVPERVFSVKGIGSYIIDKQFLPDIPILLAGVVYLAIVVSIVNLVIDLLYAVLDPRIKSSIKNR